MANTIDLSAALVVFAASEQDVTRIDISAGPCARGNRTRPLVSPTAQWHSDGLVHLRALYRVLVGASPDRALDSERVAGQGHLGTLATDFAAALVELVEMERAGIEAALRSHGPVTLPERWQSIARGWLAAADWGPRMQESGLTSRLVVWAGEAAKARHKAWRLYAWEGPSVPAWGLVAGVGAESYAEYRSRKRSKR